MYKGEKSANLDRPNNIDILHFDQSWRIIRINVDVQVQ